MIARVIPIKRVPAHLETFDYAVPENVRAALRVGQLVTIPFRQSIIFGLIFSIEKKNDETLKEIDSIYIDEPLLGPMHLEQIMMMSKAYGVAPGTIAKMMLPPLQKRKLKKVTVTAIEPKPRGDVQTPAYHQYTNPTDHRTLLQKLATKTTLILVPEVQHIDGVVLMLSKTQQKNVVAWHSQLSTKEKFERWFQIRNSEKNIIVGTRGACLLPSPSLDTIIVDYEQHDQHKHWDQAPRFHAKDIATWLAKKHGADYSLMSSSPSCDAYFGVHKKKIAGTMTLPKNVAVNVSLVDMTEERRAGRFALLSDAVKEALRAAKGDIFLFIQRRGFSTSVGCNGCGFVVQCDTCHLPYIFHESSNVIRCHYCHAERPMIRTCPTCNIDAVVLRGAGTEFLESGIRTFFSNDDAKAIIRIDGDLPYDGEHDEKKQRVVIGTEMALPHIRWDKTDMMVCGDIDKQLTMPEYLAAEHVWHLLGEMMYEKREEAMLYIQTSNPKHVALRGLTEPDRFYRTELNARKTLGYPPYKYLVRYFYGGDTAEGAKKEVARVHKTIKASLTKDKKSAMLSAPVEMHPRYYRKKYWYTFLAKLDRQTMHADLEYINNHTPSTWKIDPHPINILHP